MAPVAKDEPLSEITLRRYEKPSLRGRELVKKLCLSLGLLQPGDSRDVIVDVLYVILKARKDYKDMKNKDLSPEEIRDKVIEIRKRNNLALLGIATSNIRRQIKRLKDLLLIEKTSSGGYRITENLSLEEVFKEKIKRYIIDPAVVRISDYLILVDKEFS